MLALPVEQPFALRNTLPRAPPILTARLKLPTSTFTLTATPALRPSPALTMHCIELSDLHLDPSHPVPPDPPFPLNHDAP